LGGGSKDGWCVRMTLPPSCADCLEIMEPQPPGNLKPCPGLLRIAVLIPPIFILTELRTNGLTRLKHGGGEKLIHAGKLTIMNSTFGNS